MTNVFEDRHKRVSKLEHLAFGSMELVILDGGKDTGSPKVLGEPVPVFINLILAVSFKALLDKRSTFLKINIGYAIHNSKLTKFQS